MTGSTRTPLKRVVGWHAARIAALFLLADLTSAAAAEQQHPDATYYLVGVSGGLQDGFAARHWLDYHHGLPDENKALLVGSALVKGYKAYLDVKQKGWREYVEEPGDPLVNPVVVPSGCAEHANIYAIYAVDSRQVMNALLSEPRFLSMTPDTGLADLAAEETGEHVKALARHQAELEGKGDLDSAAFLVVTGVWAPGSLIESPVIYTKPDGTQVTDYPRSLALWAGTTDDARLADDETVRAEYWRSFRGAIRRAESQQQRKQQQPPPPDADVAAAAGAGAVAAGGGMISARPLSECRSPARYGSGPETVRMGREYTAAELLPFMPEVVVGGAAAAGATITASGSSPEEEF